jgi:hypothetical protein
MDKADLVVIVREFVHMHGQLFGMIQTLTLSLKATQELMEDRGDRAFRDDLQTKMQFLQDGEFGQQLALDKAAFDASLRRVMTNLIQE